MLTWILQRSSYSEADEQSISVSNLGFFECSNLDEELGKQCRIRFPTKLVSKILELGEKSDVYMTPSIYFGIA